MTANTLYSVKIIVKESSYHCNLVSLSDNDHDPFGKCTQASKEGFWQWPVTSTNLSVAPLHFQTKQTKQRVSRAVQGKLFAHWSLTEAQLQPWGQLWLHKSGVCKVPSEARPRAEKQARALPLLPLLTIYLTWTFLDPCRDFSLFCCPMKHHEAVLMDK